MVDLPKPGSDRRFWDAHKPKIVDNRDKPGDNEHKAKYIEAVRRKATRYGYDRGDDAAAYDFGGAPAPDRQGKPGYRRTTVPVVTSPFNEHQLVEEMHSMMQRAARSHCARAEVCQRTIGGFLAQLKLDGSPDDMKSLVAELAEAIEAIDGAEVQLLK
jgi:hypothetical protein